MILLPRWLLTTSQRYLVTPDSHTLADLALVQLILRVVVTIQHSSIPMLRSQQTYRVRLQSIMFDRLCIIRVLKIECKQSSAQPVLVLLVRIAFLVILCTWAHK
ncbi:hypothetical protein SS50377_27719 [Spironucleus salmonicida]|uniref:Uncharacterized protein n=1 Tax=Spironucleus salmonicida TaxID=348837 RepID=A0A9P8LKI0_9EUKA|nr:hypothetical protein SS50377_27719 [Spironucleus salmonicida]